MARIGLTKLILKLGLYFHWKKFRVSVNNTYPSTPLWSYETRWNHIDAEAYFLKVKYDSPNGYLMPFENVVN